MGHDRQLEDPLLGANHPELQLVQLEELIAALKNPREQFEHDDADALLYFPFSQNEQFTEPSGEYSPASQAVHRVAALDTSV